MSSGCIHIDSALRESDRDFFLSPGTTDWLVQYGGGDAGAFVPAGASALAGAVILTFAYARADARRRPTQ